MQNGPPTILAHKGLGPASYWNRQRGLQHASLTMQCILQESTSRANASTGTKRAHTVRAEPVAKSELIVLACHVGRSEQRGSAVLEAVAAADGGFAVGPGRIHSVLRRQLRGAAHFYGNECGGCQRGVSPSCMVWSVNEMSNAVLPFFGKFWNISGEKIPKFSKKKKLPKNPAQWMCGVRRMAGAGHRGMDWGGCEGQACAGAGMSVEGLQWGGL